MARTGRAAAPAAARGNASAPPLAKNFIGYAREDQEEVKDLYRRLRASASSPWMDDENLVLGDPWARTIDEAIGVSRLLPVPVFPPTRSTRPASCDRSCPRGSTVARRSGPTTTCGR